MDKKYKDILAQSIFVKKKEWIWILVFLVGGVFLIAAMCLDCGVIERGRFADIVWWKELRAKLWLASEAICDVVVAYSTMLAAIVIFYYSVIENKRLGIPYRQIISYTIGPHTIPALFVAVLLLTVFMLISCYIPWKHTTYACAIYLFVIQTFVIIEILLSTSYEHGKRVICRIERKRYLKGIDMDKDYNAEWAYHYGHLEHAIHSEEFASDKKEFLTEFLWIPFDKKTGTLYKGEFLWEKLEEKQLLEKIYKFYFANILSAFQNFDGSDNHLARNQLYLGIGEFMKALIGKIESNMDIAESEIYLYMVFSGIMNGLVSSNVEDSLAFCDYVFTKCLSDGEMWEKQLGLLVLFQEVLDLFERESIPKQVRINRLRGWKPIEKKEIPFYAYFWEIWTNMYNLSQFEKMSHFRKAMQSMCGRCNESTAISRMLLPMVKMKSEGDYGEGSIHKNTAIKE